MKKTLMAILFTLLLFLLVSCARAELVAPCASSSNTIKASITLNSSSGIGGARVTLLAGYTAETTVYIQQLEGGTWNSIAVGSGSTSCTKTFTASKGVSYRVYAVCTVKNSTTGTVVERLSSYSSVKSY